MMKIFPGYALADTHIHIKSDEHGAKRIEPENLAECLESNNLGGAIILYHSEKRDYEKNFSKAEKFCKGYSNLIPAVEISGGVFIKYYDIDYEIKCHAAYLGKIPINDMHCGSWFCHATKYGGVLCEAENLGLNIDNLSFNHPSIMESTTSMVDALRLRGKGHIALLGTDSHPNKKLAYSILGKMGIMIEGEDFNYNAFMDSLKKNSVGYFARKAENYFYFSPADLSQDKIIPKRFKL
jgi:hypothetical protein